MVSKAAHETKERFFAKNAMIPVHNKTYINFMVLRGVIWKHALELICIQVIIGAWWCSCSRGRKPLEKKDKDLPGLLGRISGIGMESWTLKGQRPSYKDRDHEEPC